MYRHSPSQTGTQDSDSETGRTWRWPASAPASEKRHSNSFPLLSHTIANCFAFHLPLLFTPLHCTVYGNMNTSRRHEPRRPFGCSGKKVRPERITRYNKTRKHQQSQPQVGNSPSTPFYEAHRSSEDGGFSSSVKAFPRFPFAFHHRCRQAGKSKKAKH